MKPTIVTLSLILLNFSLVFSQVESSITFEPTTGNYLITYQGDSTTINLLFEPTTKITPRIKAKVNKYFNSFIYRYTVYNDISSLQRLEDFNIDILTSIREIINPDTSWKNSWFSFVPVFGWYNSKGEGGLNHPLNGIAPDSNVSGFSFISDGLPSIVNSYFKGKPSIYLAFPDEPPGEIYNLLKPISIFPNNCVIRSSISPQEPSDPLVIIEFVDTLLSFNFRSFQLGWIRQEQTKNKYAQFLSAAKLALQHNNISLARSNLQKILRDVDIDSSGAITSEAYALLRYNTEYLLGKLPQVVFMIDNIRPSITTTKTKEFTLSVNGNGFTPVSIVYFNGMPRKTMFVSGTLLKVVIDNKDAEKDGRYSVCVVNDEGKSSDTLYLNIYKKLPKEVNPLLNCIEEVGKEKYRAWFGYENKNDGSVLLDQESENKFDPAPQDRGQPKIFFPGKHDKVFSVDFEGNKKLMWKLDKEKIDASKNSPRCE